MNGINASISGMNTAAKRLAISAHNVANSQTDGFQAQRAINGETVGGGVEIAEIRETPAYSVAEGDVAPSNVDVSSEITHQVVDGAGYEANAKILKAQHDTVGTLLDIVE